MMKFLILLLCVFAAVHAEETADSAIENIDISEVLGNEKLVKAYAYCMINKGPCTAEMQKIKDLIPEAVETKCAKCTEKQKQSGKQLIKEMREKYPGIWKELTTYFDPEGKNKESLEEFLSFN